jgi:predicted nucleic-acid-binding protein
MIALDTNCLLRRILKNDLAQLAKVDVLFALPEKILITDVVLVETIWAMKSFLVPKPNHLMNTQNPLANKGIYTFDSGALMLNNTIEP